MLAGLLTGLAVSWGAPLRANAVPPGRPAQPALKVGVSFALTGPDARWGVPMLRGVELAVADVNGRSGAHGRALEIVVLDSAGPGLEGISQWRGMNNYQRLISRDT